MSGHGVQAMFGTQADFQAHEGSTILGHVRDAGTFPSISGLLLGHDVQAMSRTRTQLNFQAFLGNLQAWCRGHVQGAAQLSGISRLCPGSDRDTVGFQAFLGSCWETACMPYLGYVLGMAEMQSNFLAFLGHDVQAMSGPWQGCKLIFRYFRAVSGTMCRPCPECILTETEMQPHFQAFQGSF
ncbi:Hypothetical predicted protein [Olea europaea subsp. europaea]|uniref:Uncharacterized protein n=1 Tax=Olea europaea subsp. europaea TaxID=158383 RepID=A0A8S0TCI7_OLEEU|nr:Hypothetical predicted protein [Olea europaea subsp. europaea]